MSQRCVIPDAFKFAADGRRLEGTIPIAECSRLADMTTSAEGDIAYVLGSSQGVDGKWQLELEVSGMLRLVCQRCLTEMPWPFELASTLLLVRPGEEIPEEELEDETRDAIEVQPDLEVKQLVEDEILLAVPIVPRHEQCEIPQPSGGVTKESPFAALSGLKKPGSVQ